jgi:hypothetical protein
MKDYVVKPIPVQAGVWEKLGDIPELEIDAYPHFGQCECGHTLREHGVLYEDDEEKVICPGMWVVRNIFGEIHLEHPEIFKKHYELYRGENGL